MALRLVAMPRGPQDSQDYDDRNLPVPETDSFSVYLREVNRPVLANYVITPPHRRISS